MYLEKTMAIKIQLHGKLKRNADESGKLVEALERIVRDGSLNTLEWYHLSIIRNAAINYACTKFE